MQNWVILTYCFIFKEGFCLANIKRKMRCKDKRQKSLPEISPHAGLWGTNKVWDKMQTWIPLLQVNPNYLWQGIAMAGCSPGKDSWEPRVIARLVEAAAWAARSWNACEGLVWAQRQGPWPDVAQQARSSVTRLLWATGWAQAQLLPSCLLAWVGPAVKLKTSSQGRGEAVSHL